MASRRNGKGFAAVTDQVLDEWRATRRRMLDSNGGADSVHAWRVCTRRLLALEFLLRRGGVRGRAPCEKAVRDAFHAAGKLRDAQVAMRSLTELKSRFAAAGEIAGKLRSEAPLLRHQVLSSVRHVHTRDLRALAAQWFDERDAPGAAELRATRRLDITRRSLERALGRWQMSAQGDPQRALHQLRIQAKNLRYMLELIELAIGSPAAFHSALTSANRLQSALGRGTDLQALLHRIEKAGRKYSRKRVDLDALRAHLLRQYQQLLRALSQRDFHHD